jgi:hypothetical protein
LKTRDYIIIAFFAVFLVGSFVAYFVWGIGKFGWLVFK